MTRPHEPDNLPQRAVTLVVAALAGVLFGLPLLLILFAATVVWHLIP